MAVVKWWSDSRRGPFTAIYYSHNESQRFYWSFFSFFLFLFLSCQSNLAVNCSPWQWIAAPFICQSFKDWPRNGSLNSIHIHCEFSVTVTATMALVLSAIDMQKKRRRRATIGFEQVTRKGSDNDWLWITRSATTAAAILWLYLNSFIVASDLLSVTWCCGLFTTAFVISIIDCVPNLPESGIQPPRARARSNFNVSVRIWTPPSM